MAKELWTIDDLSARAVLALEQDYEGQASARVRDVPDLRTIRYYTTLGILDRPAEMRGRTAYYGERHLLQLVAIKRLQARGLSLREIQQRLLGLSDTRLRRIAEPSPTTHAAVAAPADDDDEDAFWRRTPHFSTRAIEAGDPESVVAARVLRSRTAPPHLEVLAAQEMAPFYLEGESANFAEHSHQDFVDENAQPSAIRSFTGVELTPDVMLLLQSTQVPDEHDLERIRAAAEPLLKLLETRRLVRARTERRTS